MTLGLSNSYALFAFRLLARDPTVVSAGFPFSDETNLPIQIPRVLRDQMNR